MKTNQRLLLQIIFWGFVTVGLPQLLSGGQLSDSTSYRSIGFFLGAMIILPLNTKVLFPNFYKKGKTREYFFIIVGLILSLSLVMNTIKMLHPSIQELPFVIRQLPEKYHQTLFFLAGIFPFLIIVLTNTVFEISIYANETAREASQLKTEKLESELKFLKSQINPHFLFNALNNIYTLTVLDPKMAGSNLLKLSEMLRYLLYECDADRVSLGQELTYLKNYLALFLLKEDEQPLDIQFDAKDVDPDVQIAPLLLIPFIENALKHSQIEDLTHGWIKIKLLGDQDQIYFEVKNSIPQVEFAKDRVGGIGLKNVKRQLNLIYPNQHYLNIEKKEGEFSIELNIKLKKS